jgi:hypothetical protein
MQSELKQEHSDIIAQYLADANDLSKKIEHYIISVSRDGETPPRSIISYSNIVEAVEGYSMYTDAGFARDYLTVCLYEPSGKINKKVLKRNQAGDPSFVRQNYRDVVDVLSSLKDKLDKDTYEDSCIKIMNSFAKDNWRFNPERFLDQLGIERKL